MSDKFTIRDFFAYFLCGFAFIIALLYTNFERIVQIIVDTPKENIEKVSSFLIFLTIPVAYFCGQFIQSLDVIFYTVGDKIWKSYQSKSNRLKKIVYYLISGHRITGSLNLRNIGLYDFWKKCNELELVSKYGHAEYSYIMNGLFHGITLISSLFSVYNFCYGSPEKGLIFLGLVFLFWIRAKFYATIFIDTVLSTREALDHINPTSIKS